MTELPKPGTYVKATVAIGHPSEGDYIAKGTMGIVHEAHPSTIAGRTLIYPLDIKFEGCDSAIMPVTLEEVEVIELELGGRVAIQVPVGYIPVGSVGTIKNIVGRDEDFGYHVQLDGVDVEYCFSRTELKPHIEDIKDEAYWRDLIATEVEEYANEIREKGGAPIGAALFHVITEAAMRIRRG